MYELEYLYEQLKMQMTEYDLICSTNSVNESAYDIYEPMESINETMQLIEEAAKKKGFGKLNALKSKITSTQKVLNKYKDKASKVNPIGLQYSGYKNFVSDSDIKKKYDAMLKYLNTFNPDKAGEEELKKYINDSANNIQYYKMSEIFGGAKQFKMADVIVAKTFDKEIKKSDISNAIKAIETADKKLKDIQEQQRKSAEEYTNYVRNTGLLTDKTSKDLNKLRNNAKNHKRALIAIADATYFDAMIRKYSQELDQYKRIVIKAANYNPRNLKESYDVQDYIDSMCSFYEATNDFDLE